MKSPEDMRQWRFVKRARKRLQRMDQAAEDLRVALDLPPELKSELVSLLADPEYVRHNSVVPGEITTLEGEQAWSEDLQSAAGLSVQESQTRERLRSRKKCVWLSTLAAIFCVAALIGSLVLTLLATQNYRKTGSSTVTQTPLPASSTTVGGKAVALQTIHMFDARRGWAITYDHNRILHTTAGITRWQDVSPALDTPTSILVGADFLNLSTAWAAVASGTASFVYRTNDGGQTWQKALIPDQIVGDWQITFLNAQFGWLLAGKGAATGSEAVDVLHTNDGGATWKVVSVTGYTNHSPTALPFGGDKSGISFVSATTGWATGLSATSNFVWLYVTHDSGATWQHQTIPLARNAGNGQISALSPVFFNATDGILPIVFAGLTNQTTIIYVTRNGGESWNATAPLPITASPQLFDFVEAAHGWIVNNVDDPVGNRYIHSMVYRTGDGGQHWTPFAVKLNADMEMLDFASPTQGWAIDSTQTLYQTVDGGQTWTKESPKG